MVGSGKRQRGEEKIEPKITLGFLGLDVRLRVCVKKGKSSLRNMGEGDCSPGSESAHCEESTNRKI